MGVYVYMNNIKDRFEFEYENSADACYLIIKVGNKEKIEQFQVEMIANNPASGVLSLDVRHKDGNIDLYYNITSKTSLSHFLQNRKLSEKELVAISKNVVTALLDCKKYLLWDKSFVIDQDYIFINPSTLETAFIYLPMALETDVSERARELITRLVMQTDEKPGCSVKGRIRTYAGDESFKLADLNRLLREAVPGHARNRSKPLNRNKEGYLHNRQSSMERTAFNRGAVRSMERTTFNREVQSSRIGMEKLGEAENIPGKTGMEIPRAAKGKSNNSTGKTDISYIPDTAGRKTKPAGTAFNYKIIKLFVAVFSQIVLISPVIIFWNTVRSMGNDIVTTIAGICMAIAGIDYFLFKALFHGRVVAGNLTPTTLNEKNFSKTVRSNNIRLDLHKERADIRQRKSACESAGATHNNLPYLVEKKKGIKKKIQISKASFVIGRVKEQVDFVSDNKAIGKIHSEIITRNGRYYLKDLNSRNGTYINNTRLNSNKEYELKNNDTVAFANSCYTFIAVE